MAWHGGVDFVKNLFFCFAPVAREHGAEVFVLVDENVETGFFRRKVKKVLDRFARHGRYRVRRGKASPAACASGRLHTGLSA
jgi:hypothetical protein